METLGVAGSDFCSRTPAFYSAARKSWSESSACFKIWRSVERLTARCAGTVVLICLSGNVSWSRAESIRPVLCNRWAEGIETLGRPVEKRDARDVVIVM
jgi:hypothetical protein